METALSIFKTCLPLKDIFAKNYGYMASPHYYIDALGDEMNELKSKRDDEMKKVEAAERNGLEVFHTVKLWLENVDKLEKEVWLMKDEYEARLQLPAVKQATSIHITYVLSKKADETMEEVLNLKKKTFDKVADEFVQVSFEVLPTVTTDTVGMGPKLEELKASLDDNDKGIIGIFGMGGVGKTALLKKFNNEYLVEAEGINMVIYIEVTRNYDVKEIQTIIGERIGMSWDNKDDFKERAVALYKVLGKMNFVIILDDLWERIELKDIGIPVPEQQSKSKIFLATRIQEVCDQMDVRGKIEVKCLPWEHAWVLFQQKVGDVLAHANREMRDLAQTVARKCEGLPLALIEVGRTMASKSTTKDWKQAITELNIAPWELLGRENDLFMTLKHSHDNLPNDNLRLCLLYCSLYPENFPLSENYFIDYLVGEGFIENVIDEDTEINKGHDLFNDLRMASLLESKEEEKIKMHPMVRAMVLWVASDNGKKETKVLVRAGIGLKKASGTENWSEAERISFINNKIVELYEQPKCPSLKTLLLQENPKLKKICEGFFQYMPILCVLDLSHTSISELPSGLSALVQLQYFDICNTKITVLPSELGELVNLRIMLLSKMSLQTIPKGVLCRLAMLQVLSMELSYSNWKVGTSESGVELEELERLQKLKTFDPTIETLAALERLAQSPHLAGSTRNLVIKSAAGLKTLEIPSSDLWENMTELERVHVLNCVDLEEVVINGPDDRQEKDPNMLSNIIPGGNCTILDELEFIILERLLKAKIIYKGGCLQQLCSLYICYCPGLEYLITCANNEGDEEPHVIIEAFPKLKKLELEGLQQLKRFSHARNLLSFPFLESLKVIDCPKLKKFELSAEQLMEIHGTKAWWNALEWDDDMEVREGFTPLFQPLQ